MAFSFRSVVKYLESKGSKLEHELHGEENGEYDIENIQELCVQFRLSVEFHGKTECVDQDHDKDGVFKDWRSDKGPQLVLDRVLGYVSPHWFGIQCKLYTIPL